MLILDSVMSDGENEEPASSANLAAVVPVNEASENSGLLDEDEQQVINSSFHEDVCVQNETGLNDAAQNDEPFVQPVLGCLVTSVDSVLAQDSSPSADTIESQEIDTPGQNQLDLSQRPKRCRKKPLKLKDYV